MVHESKMPDSTKSLVESILKNPNDLLKKINSYIDELSIKGNDKSIYMNVDKLKKVDDVINPDSAFKLVSNYKTVKVLNDLIDDVEGLGNSIKSLLSDMLFGGTELPL